MEIFCKDCYPVQKMKFFVKDFFSKCDQMKKFLMENFIFCTVLKKVSS